MSSILFLDCWTFFFFRFYSPRYSEISVCITGILEISDPVEIMYLFPLLVGDCDVMITTGLDSHCRKWGGGGGGWKKKTKLGCRRCLGSLIGRVWRRQKGSGHWGFCWRGTSKFLLLFSLFFFSPLSFRIRQGGGHLCASDLGGLSFPGLRFTGFTVKLERRLKRPPREMNVRGGDDHWFDHSSPTLSLSFSLLPSSFTFSNFLLLFLLASTSSSSSS